MKTLWIYGDGNYACSVWKPFVLGLTEKDLEIVEIPWKDIWCTGDVLAKCIEETPDVALVHIASLGFVTPLLVGLRKRGIPTVVIASNSKEAENYARLATEVTFWGLKSDVWVATIKKAAETVVS